MFAINWWEVVVMEKQDLRKFKRKDLLELLLKQATRIKELEDEIIEINLSKNGYSYIELVYPFKELHEFSQNLIDNKNYKVSNFAYEPYRSAIVCIKNSGDKSANGYIKIRTPNDLYSENTIHIEGLNTYSAAGNYTRIMLKDSIYWSPNNKQNRKFFPPDSDNYIYIGEARWDQSFSITKTITGLQPNTDYYLQFSFNDDDISADDNYKNKVFINKISFYSCSITKSATLPTIISGKSICLYDGLGKTSPYVDEDYFDIIDSNLIFNRVSTLTGHNLDFRYRSNSNCCGNFLYKSYRIEDSAGGFTDAAIFKLKKQIDTTSYSKIKITCLNYHDWNGSMSVGSYCRLSNNNEDIVIPTASSALGNAEQYNWRDWTVIYSGQIPANVERFATVTLDLSELNGIYDLYFGVYHGSEVSGYTAHCGVVEIEFQDKDGENSNVETIE